MKYGEQLEKQSVPGWSFHNIDYNALKHHIKTHTTRDQAAAIPIPGHQDTALRRFEDELFAELRSQHDRVDLFVASKADEIGRRLDYLSNQIHQLTLRGATSSSSLTSSSSPSGRRIVSPKRRRRLARHEQALLQCGDDIQSLQRFVDAQVVAFRKILKKYRRWTGSAALGARFRDAVLMQPKSFTRRDFSPLQTRYEELLETLRAQAIDSQGDCVGGGGQGAVTPIAECSDENASVAGQDTGSEGLSSPAKLVNMDLGTQPQRNRPRQTTTSAAPAGGYWNEYDNGSEAGDLGHEADGGYAIYINPDEDRGFPGVATVVEFLSKPVKKMRSLFSIGSHNVNDSQSRLSDVEEGTTRADAVGGEHTPLLPPRNQISASYGSQDSYFARPPGGGYMTDTEVEEDSHHHTRSSSKSTLHQEASTTRTNLGGYAYASSSEDFSLPASGYATHYAAAKQQNPQPRNLGLPSVAEQRVALRYRERVLGWATAGGFASALAFLVLSAALVETGRHRLRIEVDAAAASGVVASLGCACAALGCYLAMDGRRSWVERTGVGVAFVVDCVLCGILLVFLVGNGGGL